MNYKKTLTFLYSQLPMFQRQGRAAFKKDLTNIRLLLEALDNPHHQFSSIHVAGTNGKGSVAHLLSAALQAGGLKTGLYTSPHYKDFRERIKVDGIYMSKQGVVHFVEKITPLLTSIQPSFFEITVAMAFDYFARQKVDMAIVEVGLGGRLDSTNILTPALSVITNIGMDHQQFLGDTLPLIASEKAGIIKKEVAVVIGQTHEETATVFREKALLENAPIYFADQQFRVIPKKEDWTHTYYKVLRQQGLYAANLKVNWQGPYQHLNVQTALMALEIWQQHHNHRLAFETIEKGWGDLRKRSNFQGRWQILGQNPLVLTDSAHNEDGLKAIIPTLIGQTKAKLHIVLAVVEDKELDKVLPLFPKEARYYFAKAMIPRGLAADVLQRQASQYGLNGKTYVSVQNALKAARRQAKPKDTIFVGGSIFTAAEVLP